MTFLASAFDIGSSLASAIADEALLANLSGSSFPGNPMWVWKYSRHCWPWSVHDLNLSSSKTADLVNLLNARMVCLVKQ